MVLIVLDHKQDILPMMYPWRSGGIFWKESDDKVGDNVYTMVNDHKGDQYGFEDYIIDGCTGQDNIQAGVMVSMIIDWVNNNNPKISHIVFQSDNDSFFSSQELIPFIHHINKDIKCEGESNLQVTRWIFIEAQTGSGCLDTHFSYLNFKFNIYAEDGNDMTTPENVFQAMVHSGGVSGTTPVLLDASQQ